MLGDLRVRHETSRISHCSVPEAVLGSSCWESHSYEESVAGIEGWGQHLQQRRGPGMAVLGLGLGCGAGIGRKSIKERNVFLVLCVYFAVTKNFLLRGEDEVWL